MTLSGSTVTEHELVLWLFLALVLCTGIVTVRFWTGDKAAGRELPSAGPADQHADRQGWREAMQAMQARSDLDLRVRAVEQALLHVPSSSDFAELAGEVNTVKFQFESLAEGQKAIHATLYRIQDFLLKDK